MSLAAKPKRTLIAYCVLAERLGTPGMGGVQALTPFFAEACRDFAGELFDASKFSQAVQHHFDIYIPRLAALGLAEQLARDGLLTAVSRHGNSDIYRYASTPTLEDVTSPVTEAEVVAVLTSFVDYAKADDQLRKYDDSALEAAFLDRLLNADSMRILGRREGSISAKKTPETIIRKDAPRIGGKNDAEELHLDFLVSQFLLDLRTTNTPAFDRVSAVAFANMAAEAIACFREPPTPGTSLDSLTVFLDSPLLLDMLGVNSEYADYGQELLDAIRASGAHATVLDHCVTEAESAVKAQLAYVRSGVNRFSAGWGTTAKPDLLAALVGNVAERAEKRLGIEVQRDPELNLHRRSPVAVGNIEAEMNNRMQAWGNEEAREHDRKSIWSMLAMRQSLKPCDRICDSTWLLLARNPPLVAIANSAWRTWLREAAMQGSAHVDRWAPIAMSDKQFAGYLWARTGGGNGAISKARLLSHCSAAVRPRADVKARAYNLVLELHGRAEADDVAALLEDREGGRALMRAAHGDPEDVTRERLPLILEKVKLAAGEFAAAQARVESARQLEDARAAHSREMERTKADVAAAQEVLDRRAREAEIRSAQQALDHADLEAQNAALRDALDEHTASERERKKRILEEGFKEGHALYTVCRWLIAVLFGLLSGAVVWLATVRPVVAASVTVLLSVGSFWFVPDLLKEPLSRIAMQRMRAVIASKDSKLAVPAEAPNFKSGKWEAIAAMSRNG
jgi:hypothetical protein